MVRSFCASAIPKLPPSALASDTYTTNLKPGKQKGVPYHTLEAAKAAADKLFKEDKENRPENLAVAYTLDDCIRDIEENPLYVVGEWQKNAFGSYHNFYAVFSVSLAEN